MKALSVRVVVAVVVAAATLQAVPAASQTYKCKGQVANIVGTTGDDEIGGTQNRDVIVARGGDDEIFARDGNDLICAGPGDDAVNGRGGDDRILGEGGSDLLHGAAGNDTVKAGPGILHVLVGHSGNDRITGNKLFAIVFYETAKKGVNVDLVAGTARGHGRDRLRNVHFVVGSKHDDVLKGNAKPNVLYGNSGDDTLRAGGNRGSLTGLRALGVLTNAIEADILDGDGVYDVTGPRQPGNDTLVGGPGLNVATYLSSPNPMDVDLNRGRATGQGTDNLTNVQMVIGSVLDDELKGDAGENGFEGEAGVDDINGRGGDDTITFLDASTVDVDLGAGEATATHTYGTEGSGETATDTLRSIEDVLGSFGNDSLTGNGSDNQIFGFQGDDTLAGAAGDDTLFGGGGSDDVSGGAGVDSCDGEKVSNCEQTSSRQARRDGPVTSLAGSLRLVLSALHIAEPAWSGYRFHPIPVSN